MQVCLADGSPVAPTELLTGTGKEDSILKVVQGTNVPLWFALFLVGSNREVQDMRLFSVRLSPQRHTPTSAIGDKSGSFTQYTYLAAGTLDTVQDDEVDIVPWQGWDTIKFAFDEQSKVSASDLGWQAEAAKWADVKASLKTNLKRGDQLSVVYTEKDGRKLVRQLAYVPADSWARVVPVVNPFVGLQFQIGIVISANVDSVKTNNPRDMILVTKSGARRWRIRDSTLIMRGALDGTRADLSQASLVAVGAPELKGDEVQATQVLILKDLTESAAR